MKKIINHTLVIIAFAVSFNANAQQTAAEDWKNEIKKVYKLVDAGIMSTYNGEYMLRKIKDAARIDMEKQLLNGSKAEGKYYIVLFWGLPSDQSQKPMTIRDTLVLDKIDDQRAFYFNDLESGYIKYDVLYKPKPGLDEQQSDFTVLNDIDLPVFGDLYFVNISVKGKAKGKTQKITVTELTSADGLNATTDSLMLVIADELEKQQSDVSFTTNVDTLFTVYGGDIPSSVMNDDRIYSVGIHLTAEGMKRWAFNKSSTITKGGLYAVTLSEADSMMRKQVQYVYNRLKDKDYKSKHIDLSGILHIHEGLIEPEVGVDLEHLFSVAPPLMAYEYPSRRLKSRTKLTEVLEDSEMVDQFHQDYKTSFNEQWEDALREIEKSLDQMDIAIDETDKETEYFNVFNVEKREKDSPASVHVLLGTGFSSLASNNYSQLFAENDQWIFSPTFHIGLRGELKMTRHLYLSSELRYSVYRHRFRRNNYFTDVDGVTDFVRFDQSLNRSSLASSYFDLQFGFGVKTGWRVFSEIEVGVYGGAHSRSTSRIRYNDEQGYSVRNLQRGSFNVSPYRYGAYLSFGNNDGIQNRVMYDFNPYFSEWNGPSLNIVSYALMIYF